MSKKILYIELSTAHTEIIHSFSEALSKKAEVHLLINEKSFPRIQHLNAQVQTYKLNEEDYLNETLKQIQHIKPDFILFNSSQGRKVRNLCLRLLFSKIPVIGVHHNAENIYKSFTQKIIHLKIKKYIVLADFIKEFIQTKIKGANLKIESFYPLSYPQVSPFSIDSQYKYISIPGVLEQDRRDYLGLAQIVKQFDQQLDPQIKFVLLGSSNDHDGLQIKNLINKNDIQSRFILFDQYVKDEVLLSYIKNSSAVMPLLHPGTRWFEKYFETKISGAYNLAYAFNKILLMHEVFKGKSEFKDHGVFYNLNDFAVKLNSTLNFSILNKPEKFQDSFQSAKLINFIEL